MKDIKKLVGKRILMACALFFCSASIWAAGSSVFKITVDGDFTKGTVTLDKETEIAPNVKIGFDVVPNEGFEVETLSVTKSKDGKNVISPLFMGDYSKGKRFNFKMPKDDVVITVTFVQCAMTKAMPDAIGDLVLNDGTVIAYENIEKMSKNQKTKAVAMIFTVGTECSDNETPRTLGVGLHYSNKAAWCSRDAKALDKVIPSIQCQVTGDAGSYSFSGDRNGKDNLQKIANYLGPENDTVADTKYDPPAILNYQAFGFAKGYYGFKYEFVEDEAKLRTAKGAFESLGKNLVGKGNENQHGPNVGKTYKDGWYLPSITELFYIWKIKDKLDAAGVLCDGREFKGKYISASLQDADNFAVCTLNFDNGEYSPTKVRKNISGLEIDGNPQDAIDHWCACAIREF